MSRRLRDRALKLGLPTLKRKNNKSSRNNISSKTNNRNLKPHEEDMLKFMNRSNVYKVYSDIESLPKKIIGIDFEFITHKKVRDTISPSDLELFNIIYTKKSKIYSPTNLIVKIKKITFNNGTTKLFRNPIYFFKSTGKSRHVSDNRKLNTSNIWFPTNTYPFEMSFSGIHRITKLEDPILRSMEKNKDINIKKYGRFLNLEMSMISYFLTNLFK